MSTNDEIRKAAQAAYEKWQEDWNACYGRNEAAVKNRNPPPGGYPHVVDRILTALAPYLAPHPAQQGEDWFRATRTSDGVGSYIMYQPQYLWDDGEFGESWTNLGEPTISKRNAKQRADLFSSVHACTPIRYLEIQSTARVTDFADSSRSHSKQERGA